MEPETYIIEPHVSGDTWSSLSSITIAINGISPVFPLVSARIQFRKSYLGSIIFELNSENHDTMEIADPVTWRIVIPSQVIAAPPGIYSYDLETIDSMGSKKTYLKGTWEILEDITK
jgi:hypothetical protein